MTLHCSLQTRRRKWISACAKIALTHPLPPLPQLSVLESALGLDKLFPLHMSEQTERGIPDCSWPVNIGCVQTPQRRKPTYIFYLPVYSK